MNKLVILVFILIVSSCYSKEKELDSPNVELTENTEIKTISPKINKPYMLYDTLVFYDDMKGEFLDKKLQEGKQKMEFYKKFIVPDKIDSLQILKQEHSRTEIRYLGILKDLDTKNSYHVISNFKIIGIGEMLSPRGRSEVAFIDLQNYQAIVYNLGMPDDLPDSIRENVLYFELDNIKTGISTSGGLMPHICLPEIGCY
ncbi:MAG: hypothetical protein AAF806_16325 [Bacteroidota bacterium]